MEKCIYRAVIKDRYMGRILRTPLYNTYEEAKIADENYIAALSDVNSIYGRYEIRVEVKE